MTRSDPHGVLPLALDAMGGDFGCVPNVEGAIAAARHDGVRTLLVGDETTLQAALQKAGAADLLASGMLAVRHAPDVVDMAEKPAAAVRHKKQSSMRVACDLVEAGEACAALSAGNSGAMMAIALFVFGRIPGVIRPAIGTVMPAANPSGRLMLTDAGANTICTPEHLMQWGLLAAGYMRHAFGVERPRVAVLSNGEEESKGTDLTRGAAALLRQAQGVEFVGYAEGRDVATDICTVLVTDGFTGNVFLKTCEGVFKFLTTQIRRQYEMSGVVGKLGGGLSKGVFDDLRARLDPREFGAAPLLGLQKPAFIAHGSSDAHTLRRGLCIARDYCQTDVTPALTAAIQQNLHLTSKAAEPEKAAG